MKKLILTILLAASMIAGSLVPSFPAFADEVAAQETEIGPDAAVETAAGGTADEGAEEAGEPQEPAETGVPKEPESPANRQAERSGGEEAELSDDGLRIMADTDSGADDPKVHAVKVGSDFRLEYGTLFLTETGDMQDDRTETFSHLSEEGAWSATENNMITIEIVPDEGYALWLPNVGYSIPGDHDHPINLEDVPDEPNTFLFRMPADIGEYQVYIDPSFRPEDHQVTAESEPYTVTLLPGAGSGEPVVFSTADGIADDCDSAGNGQFYYGSGGALGFRLDADHCPETFTAPDGHSFAGWDPEISETLTSLNTVYTALWRLDGGAAVTVMPEEISLGVSGFSGEGWSAPFTVSVTDLDFGPDAQSNAYLVLTFRSGQVSGGSQTIDYRINNTGHTGNGESLGWSINRTGSLDLVIYVDPEELASAGPGLYTGELEYELEWGRIADVPAPEGGSIPLTLDIPAYTVTVADGIENGSVTADKTVAREGDIITLTAAEAPGFGMDSLTVVTGSGAQVEVSEGRFSMPAEDVTVHAVFSRRYTVTINHVYNGTVTPDKSRAGEGETVSLTVDFNENDYYLDSITVTDDGGDIELTEGEDGTWAFTMRSSDVTVSAGITAYKVYDIEINAEFIKENHLSDPDAGWSYEGDEHGGTLTLNNAHLTTGRVNNADIYSGVPLTIELAGENTISSDIEYYSKGISVGAPLTIQGSGSLTITGTYCGIQSSRDLTIRGGAEVTASCGEIGIEVQNRNSLSIENSAVSAAGGRIGILALAGSVKASGSTVTASGERQYGIMAGAFEAAGGSTVTASGGSLGIQSGSFTMTESGVASTCTGTDGYGLQVSGRMVINSGVLDAAGAEDTPTALSAAGGITLGRCVSVETPFLGGLADDGKTIVGPDGEQVQRAVIRDGFPVIVESDGHGTAEASVSFGVAGTEVALTAVPDEGYRFRGWKVLSGSESPEDPASEVTMLRIGTGAIRVQALFHTADAIPMEGLYLEFADGTDTYVYTGSKITPPVNVFYDGERLTPGRDYTVSFANNINASAAKKPAKLTVTGRGNFAGKKQILFTIAPRPIGDGTTTPAEGFGTGVISIARGQKATAPVITWGSYKLTSKDYKVTDPQAGRPYTAAGPATMEVSGRGNFSGSVLISVNVTETKAEVKKIAVTADTKTAIVYDPLRTEEETRELIASRIRVYDAADKSRSALLAENAAYTISFPRAVNTAGKKKAVVAAAGGYTGSSTKTFTIRPLAAPADAITANTDEIASKTYTFDPAGVRIGGDLVITYTSEAGTALLREGTDFTVSYTNNKAVSTAKKPAKFTVTFKGNYKGTPALKNNTFTIGRRAIADGSSAPAPELEVTIPDVAYRGRADLYTPKVYVTLDGRTLPSKNYKVECFTSAGCEPESLVSKKNKVSIPDGLQQVTVFVLVTAKGSGGASGNYEGVVRSEYRVVRTGTEASVTTYDISRARVTIYDSTYVPGAKKNRKLAGVVYNGRERQISDADVNGTVLVEYKLDGKHYTALTEGVDYTLRYVNNIGKGTAVIVVEGAETPHDGIAFVGNKTATFRITTKSVLSLLQLLFSAGGGQGTEPAGAEVTFSLPSGAYDDDAIVVQLNSAKGREIRYTLDGSVPTPESALYAAPLTLRAADTPQRLAEAGMENMVGEIHTDASLPGGFVVRAASFLPAEEAGDDPDRGPVATGVYFPGTDLAARFPGAAVVSIAADPEDLIGRERGILVKGAIFDEWSATPEGREIIESGETWKYVGNYTQTGRAWEREAVAAFFNGGEAPVWQEACGIRVKGGSSRSFGQKSLNVYFRPRYGSGEIRYELLPGAKDTDGNRITAYSSFSLRNGGNDAEGVSFRDQWLQDMAADCAADTQRGRPTVVFLNGEYWGIYTLQDKYDGVYYTAHYGVDEDNVVAVKEKEIEAGTAEDMTLYEELAGFADKDMSDPAVYASFLEAVDIDSFLDYCAFEIYIGNADWGYGQDADGTRTDDTLHNTLVWRVRTPDGTAAGDGKWRFSIFDTEFSTGLNWSSRTSADIDHVRRAMTSQPLFAAAMRSREFREAFLEKLRYLGETVFTPDSVNASLSEYAARWRPYMDDAWRRFGDHSWIWDSELDGIREFFAERYSYILGFAGAICAELDAGGT